MPNIAIITGGRDYELQDEHVAWLDGLLDEHKVDFIMVGDCKTGVDACVRKLYLDNHIKDGAVYYADWNKWGTYAGPKRNGWMAYFAAFAVAQGSLCIAFPGGRGTASMVDAAEDYGIRVIWYPRQQAAAAPDDTVPEP